ncbi:MAG: penicillin-binding protein activator [Novosphingobium sp.]
MIERRAVLRKCLIAGGIVLLAGCKVIPKGPVQQAPPPPSTDQPATGLLPSDTARHRVALLVPLSGANAGVGQAIANATTMALLDTNAGNLRITSYDTAEGAGAAASRALADGNKLVLGPLLGEDVTAAAAIMRPAKVPMITYSNDSRVAAQNVFLLGQVPSQAVFRLVAFAKSRGLTRYAGLIPSGEYGQRNSAALLAASREIGSTVTATESYDRGNTSVTSAARRLKAKGGFDAVLIADGGRMATQAAPLLKAPGAASPRLLGSELWSGDSTVLASPALRGAWFAAVSDNRFRQFASSYRTRFGAAPHRLATLGYDSVLLTIRIARDWRPGTTFPTDRMFDRIGFLGIDGPFRFARDGVAERAFEVREVGAGAVTVVSPAITKFGE